MMYIKGSDVGNSSKCKREYSSSLVSNLPAYEDLELGHQYNIRNQVTMLYDWRKHSEISNCRNKIRNDVFGILISIMHWEQRKSSTIANILESELFMDAASQEEYMDRKTLVRRLKTKVNMFRANKCCQVDNAVSRTSNMLSSSSGSLHSWSNESVPGHAFQRVLGPCINATDYGAVAAHNKHHFPKGGLSSIPKCTDLDVLSEFPAASVGGSNLEASFGCSIGNQQNCKDFEPGVLTKRKIDCPSEVMEPFIKRRKVDYESIEFRGSQADNILNPEEPTKDHDLIVNDKLVDSITGSDSNMETVCQKSMPSNTEDIQGKSGLNQDESNATEKVIEPKSQEKEMKSTDQTANIVPSTESLTRSRIKEHIRSLGKQDNNKVTTDGESGNDVYKCQLCSMTTLYFAPKPIYCLCCGISIRRNACYYYKREEEDTNNCFCTTCYKNARGGNISFNGTTVSKTDLSKNKNDGECEEAWIQCSKCKSWQHQICALYNSKSDLDNTAEYICLLCCLNENRNDVRVPFDAKDLPRTKLSDHIEGRLLKRLGQIERNKIPEVFVADNLSVRVVLSVDKHIEVKKQFLNIFEGNDYPAEFSYASKVILLFQKIDGVDVCLFAMYAQEFGSECGYPNQRSIYISYLDSVKYFRPEIHISARESLRTFVYHEILIGYLDFCKKRGFTTCYIWSCPPIKGEDYIFYCHPDSQKTPKKDQLRHWYHSALRKAGEEDIVVGLSNIYDRFFLPTGKRESKVTASRLPYFDGDFWSGAAMDKAMQIEQHTGGNREKMLKLVPIRSLKSMGCVNLSKGTAKDILVMQKLGQTISPFKEDFMVVQLQYVCIHCHKVIQCGKRWFCKDCKIFQECERCHTADSHTSVKGERHKLCQVLTERILPDTTEEKDIIFNKGLFETRYNFLSFCQKNRFQFDSLRQAKYSSMMILHFLSNRTHMTVGISCQVCCKRIVSQSYWRCETCPEFTVCSACYIARGAKCHSHTLSETCSTAQSPSGSEELKQNTTVLQELLEVVKHASQCHSTQTRPCTYPYCLKIRKLFSHASRCTVRVSGGCQHCKKVWQAIALHSKNCRDSACCIPRCMDMKKQAGWLAS
ncbi:E1A/CREB-binding protein [Vigna unguiculata]|uniref:histone acetyltransferase n=1 Tax=Vigna unguiculata TaxID=3917 RepID=A0A4D6LN75_VIGUN|nr:E1A/CREB-binding protein [Vigna unguiculata]